MKPKSRPNQEQAVSTGSRWGLLLILALGISAVTLLAVFWLPTTQPETSSENSAAPVAAADAARLDQAMEAIRQGQYGTAEALAKEINDDSPLADQASMLAGEAASRDGRIDDAVNHYRSVARKETGEGTRASFYLGELFRSVGKLEEAVEQYLKVVEREPADVEAHTRLAFLFSVTGQRWEAMPHYLALIRHQQWSLDSLALLGDLERPIEQPEFIQLAVSQNPESVWVQMGQAQVAIQQGNERDAARILRSVLQRQPNQIPAQAMLGEVIISASEEQIASWRSQLPPMADLHPDVWFTRGLLARGQSDLKRAAGCFAMALRIRPEHRRACYQLGQVLALLEDPAADKFVQRAQLLLELTQQLDEILRSRGQSASAMRRTSEICEASGRWLEAWAWSVTATRLHPGNDWSAQLAERLQPQLTATMPRTVTSFDLVAKTDLDKYLALAKAESASRPPAPEPSQTAPAHSPSQPKFALANTAGIDFVYQNGSDPATPGARMFEQTGGGVGVIDFDLDGWPDIYFTQGGSWPTGQAKPTSDPNFHDHLYRNLGGEQFRQVASEAGALNLGFGQGLAVGDFDNDGFPDLYVANIGTNQLLRNNGDGTFSDASQLLGTSPDQWTTSCVMVDLNGDGLLDIYAVNYLSGDNVFELICDGKACSPKVFPGAPDEVYLNQGDGSFRRLANATPQQEAKGLGVLAARFGDDPLPGLFIANDQVPNFFLQVTKDPADPSTIQLTDRALLRGLAYNVDGLAMACMGIAADDLTGNGLLDFLVTNFMDEPNSLYLQDAPGLFIDATRAAGLQQPSFPYVGWGTQFFDADLDGQSDLVVTNGHVDDYRSEGKLYQMPPQFFINRGRARFEQLTADSLGDYFSDNYLGRGLAKLDWNRDGLIDFAVSNINQRATLVSNQTTGAGGYLNIELIGTISARDCIGAGVEVTSDNGSWKRQLVAGDGYQASNQRLLQFGLGNATAVQTVTVDWPSGSRTIIENLPVNSAVSIVEGATRGFTRDGQPWTAVVASGSD